MVWGVGVVSAVLLFARAAVPGRVKTRLRPLLSDQQACELHRRLVQHTLTVATGSGLVTELWGSEEDPFLRGQAEAFAIPFYVQQGGDLGARMADALSQALGRYHGAVLVGSDCPELDKRYLLAADAGLQRADIVLGPATDGGYVLIAARVDEPGLFRGVEWGSDSVLASTRANIRRAGLECIELEPLADLDRPADCRRARAIRPELFAGL